MNNIDYLIIAWIYGMAVSLIFQINMDDIRGYRIVFWPISLTKWLIRAFIKALKD